MANAKQIDFLLAGIRHPLTDEPLAGGAVYTKLAGTSTDVSLYVDRDTTQGFATNPVILDAAGKAEVYGDGIYKFIVRAAPDSGAEIIMEVDGLEYKPDNSTDAVGPLDADLDFNFHKGVNVTPGEAQGEIVEFNQFSQAITAVGQDITDLENALAAVKFTDLTDTPSSYSAQALKILRVNAGNTGIEFIPIADIDPDKAFTDLTDVPTSYAGHASKTVKVKSDESGLEFVAASAFDQAFTDLSDTPADYSGQAGKYVRVKTLENGLEFVSQPTGDVPIGSVIMYAGAASPPAGWLTCAGQSLLAADYPDLATVLGVTWGAGGGVGEVRLPDLRGLFPKGAGTNDKALTGIDTSQGNAYAGGAVGDYGEDKMQGHDHTTGTCIYGGGATGFLSGSAGGILTTRGVINDIAGLYGTARPAAITEPGHFSIQFIIRVL